MRSQGSRCARDRVGPTLSVPVHGPVRIRPAGVQELRQGVHHLAEHGHLLRGVPVTKHRGGPAEQPALHPVVLHAPVGQPQVPDPAVVLGPLPDHVALLHQAVDRGGHRCLRHPQHLGDLGGRYPGVEPYQVHVEDGDVRQPVGAVGELRHADLQHGGAHVEPLQAGLDVTPHGTASPPSPPPRGSAR